jgi:large subunit ribosomal protein L10
VSKKIKELELTALRKAITGVKDYVLLEPLKVDSATDYEFRKKLREKKCSAKLVKNSLAKKIFAENGIAIEAWSGPTLLVWGSDSIKGLANAVDSTLKEVKKDPKAPDKFKEKTAVADGQAVTLTLAKTLPTRLEAIGSVLSAILGPASQIAGCLIGPGGQVAGCVQAVEEKKPADGAAADAAPAASA